LTRPTVQIKAANQITALRRHLDGVLPRLKSFPGIVGITLNGGLSRGYGDHLSEVDVTLYLTPESFKMWQNGKTPIALGITVIDGQLYDIKAANYAAEREREWEEVALWDASYAEILYDPEKLVQELLAEKLAVDLDPGRAEALLMRCWWHFELAGEIWIQRGDALQGHLMLNQALIPLVEALFVANGERIPHEKWLLHMSRSLAWKPEAWERRLGSAMSTADLTLRSVRAAGSDQRIVARGGWADHREVLSTSAAARDAENGVRAFETIGRRGQHERGGMAGSNGRGRSQYRSISSPDQAG
jgi:hypothetical protein